MPITTTPSGSPQGEFSAYTPIYATTLSSATASITLSNIPTTFTDLVMVTNFGTATNGPMTIQVNGDTSSNYSRTCLYGDGSSAASFRESNQTYLNSANGYTSLAGADFTYFMNYSNAEINKTILNKNGNTLGTTAINATTWRSTASITSIKVYNANGYNLISGSSVTLYGIKAAATQFIPTKAAGGDVVATDGTYAYHTFLTSGIFAPAQSLTCDVLVVAGGAGGGGGSSGSSRSGGGGGAGGYRTSTGFSVTNQTYAITVGAGGAGGALNGSRGSAGGNSIFSTITSTGGGGGGGSSAGAATGGSGGGGGGYTSLTSGAAGNTPSTSPSQGNSGGNGEGNLARGGGGGGSSGSGTTGNDSPGGVGGNGGAGTNWQSLGTFYAGGGGGGTDSDWVPTGIGGSGGGGNGGIAGPGGSGSANRGSGGGGGGGRNSSGGAGGPGGSGIVIVRYPL
jgi:hypothetical protein